MIVLGIDPGLETVGYGIINSERGDVSLIDYGIIKTPRSAGIPERLSMIAEGIGALIEKFKPDEVAVEELFFCTNRKTAITVAEARGVILLTAYNKCGRLYEYTPNQIKQAVTGWGGAEKAQIQQMVKVLLKLKDIPKPDDAADALAVAITHAQTSRMSGLFKI
ncbi:MAG: crossover junction endodeoxyribonuclease RuvC [Clostridia bacterium]|nr:crossover junction endodeoxyribonuclease RuvC [Clostridia bacterium]